MTSQQYVLTMINKYTKGQNTYRGTAKDILTGLVLNEIINETDYFMNNKDDSFILDLVIGGHLIRKGIINTMSDNCIKGFIFKYARTDYDYEWEVEENE